MKWLVLKALGVCVVLKEKECKRENKESVYFYIRAEERKEGTGWQHSCWTIIRFIRMEINCLTKKKIRIKVKRRESFDHLLITICINYLNYIQHGNCTDMIGCGFQRPAPPWQRQTHWKGQLTGDRREAIWKSLCLGQTSPTNRTII